MIIGVDGGGSKPASIGSSTVSRTVELAVGAEEGRGDIDAASNVMLWACQPLPVPLREEYAKVNDDARLRTVG